MREDMILTWDNCMISLIVTLNCMFLTPRIFSSLRHNMEQLFGDLEYKVENEF
jgi:hypothetical protein